MTRHSLLSALIAPIVATAQLAPGTTAPLAAHMQEVNRQWQHHALPLVTTPVRFTNDTERIAQHLHLVREHLATHAPAGLSSTQRMERDELLEVLDRYADAGRFPKNQVLPYRNPIFIDPFGTACAVGHLMIASGDRPLAERIDAAMETGYLAEILADARFHDPVATWAAAHGFTADELAWIQPGYQPPVLWTPLGGGTNGTVDEVLALANGDLLVAGTFTDAGGTTCARAARWNGSSYTALGELPDGTINCAVEHGGTLYIGGAFNNGQVDLLHWNGEWWEAETVFASKSAEVTALLSREGLLYAAGGRAGFAGIDHGVQVQEEGSWNMMPGVLNGPIHALVFHEDRLIAGGAFTGAFLSNQNELMHVARYSDGGWTQVADGLDGTVHDLLVHDNALYATGDMVSMAGTSFGLASIEGDLAEWTRLMPNIQNYITPSPVDAPSVARSMVVHGDRIFIAGDIYTYAGLTLGRGVVVYNGAPDQVEPYCDFMGPANTIALTNNDQLVVGGSSQQLHHIISTDLTTGIAPELAVLGLQLFPNPTVDRLSITIPRSMTTTTRVHVIDASGRQVNTDPRTIADRIELDTHALTAGTYVVELSDGSHTATGRFVKR